VIPDAIIEEIRNRVDIVAAIGRHLELKRAGRTWKGCCPFHGERTPSFHVYPEDRHFKCYGCGEYGDVFKFLQKLQGKEFPEVVRALAAEVGVEIPERGEDSAEQRQRRRERAEVLAACDAAARYYAARLQSRFGEEARAYLAERGLAEETVRRFRLGVASEAWSDLLARVKEKGVSEEALVKAGLLVPRSGKRPYDRFRGRLLFPIAGLDGEVIGFGARVLPGGDAKGAKYVNSPESPVYKKSRVLYGLDLARESIRKSRSAVLVEGYFDVIGLHQAGIRNAVAVCGTALTPEHVELLVRCDCREVTVLFDGDAAGLAAPARAAQAILPSGMGGKVAVLPSAEGKVDPDEFVRQRGLAAAEALLASAVPLTEFLIDRAIENAHRAVRAKGQPEEAGPERAGGPGELHPPDSMESRVAAFRELRPFARLAPAGLARTIFEERIAKRLGVDLEALQRELEAPAPARGRPAARPPGGPAAAPGRASRIRLQVGSPAVDALGVLAAYPADLAAAAEDENLLGVLPPGPVAEVARALLRGDVDARGALAQLEGALDAASLSRLRQLAGPAAPRKEHADRELRRSVVRAKVEGLEGEHERLLVAVTRAGSPAPEDLVTEQGRLAERLRDLRRRLAELERP
jgi:DNA primase